jgi:TolA-binding protein
VVSKYAAVVETYPSTPAAISAGYQAANALAALGRVDEAVRRYQHVIERDRNGIYGQMAQLGLADAYQGAGQFDKAIEIYQALSTGADTRLPVDGVLMRLARAYTKAGKTDDAARTYTRIVEEFPQSLYASDARAALTAIKKS